MGSGVTEEEEEEIEEKEEGIRVLSGCTRVAWAPVGGLWNLNID
jgi:hypothetical protein